MPFPKELAPELTFLTPDIDLGERANEARARLGANGLVVAAGLTEQYVPHISDIAVEPDVREYCPDDFDARFATVGAARRWHAGGKMVVGIFNAGFDVSGVGSDDLRLLEKKDMLEQVAYGWLSKNPDGSVAAKHRVGALGTHLARKRAADSETGRVRLGLSLGEVVLGVGVRLEGIDPHKLALDYWKSNDKAAALYQDLGFTSQYSAVESRPTRQPIGYEFPSGNVVYPGLHKGKLKRMVEDVRVTSKLTDHPLLAA